MEENNIYKKGNVVEVVYNTSSNKKISTGVVYESNDSEITIAHNFSGINPIDITKINIEDIEESRVIPADKVKEIF